MYEIIEGFFGMFLYLTEEISGGMLKQSLISCWWGYVKGKNMPRKQLLIRQCAFCGREFATKHLHQKTCSIRCGVSLSRKQELERNEAAGISQVWACGGGAQSTAIAALICTGKLPKPDYVVVVDCGWEKTLMFEQVESIKLRLAEVGVEINMVKTINYADNSLFAPSGYMRLPLYINVDGEVKKLPTHCSWKWKNQVVSRWLRKQGVKRCDVWIGISVDEKRRMKPSRVKWKQNRYPLIELGITREDCIDLVARLGWPKPEHTACLVCPNQNNHQWQRMKDMYPDDWRCAVEAEAMIRDQNDNMWLHRECQPLDDIDFDALGY